MRHSCRICGHTEHREIFRHPETPLFIGIIGDNTPEELADIKLPISLVCCEACHTVQQPAESQVDALLDKIYLASKDNACSGTRTGEGEFGMQRAELFLKMTGLSAIPDRVLEIGCNEGHMLAICKNLGADKIVGVEPSVKEEYSPAPGIIILPGYFDGSTFSGNQFDLVYLIEVFEHIPNPTEFLRDVHRVLAPDGKLAMSVPNCETGLEYGNIGMPIHEHLLYFTPVSMESCLRRAGFDVLQVQSTFSHLYCLAQKTDRVSQSDRDETVRTDNFWPECERRFEQVADFARSQRSPWGIYGACSLTANLLAWGSELDLEQGAIIDADPNKWSHIVSGCRLSTISPNQAVEAGVRNVIVMPFGFQEGIESYIQRNYPTITPTLLYRGLASHYAERDSSG